MNGAWGFRRSTKEPVWWMAELQSEDSGRCMVESNEERRGRGSGFPGYAWNGYVNEEGGWRVEGQREDMGEREESEWVDELSVVKRGRAMAGDGLPDCPFSYLTSQPYLGRIGPQPPHRQIGICFLF